MTPEDLRSWRTETGISQAKLARVLGMTKRAVEHWEQRTRAIPVWLPVALPEVGRRVRHARAQLVRDRARRMNQLLARQRREARERSDAAARVRARVRDPAAWW